MNRFFTQTSIGFALSLAVQAQAQALPTPEAAMAAGQLKPRLVVLTDIAPGNIEPDDMESMVRLMAYADQVEIEALITTIGWNCDPYPTEWADSLWAVIDAYDHDVKNLMRRSAQTAFLPLGDEQRQQVVGYWPSASYLRSRVAMGSQRAGIGVIGKDNRSPGSDLIIRLADEDDPRPIYVAAWGGANTLAQAIWQVQQERTPAQLKAFLNKLRVYTITDQDMQYSMRMNRAYSSHQWMRREFQEDLLFIWDEGTWQEQCELGKRHWQQHVDHIQGKGALGKIYPTYKWGVEGDTPSFLYVIPNGLSNPEDPLQAGWAGYHERGLCADSLTTAWTSWQEPVRSISVGYKTRFYPDELNDFMARMQWADEGQGNRNPNVSIVSEGGSMVRAGILYLTAKPGTSIHLDASSSSDPDGDQLSFHWWQQPEIGMGIGQTRTATDVLHSPLQSVQSDAETGMGIGQTRTSMDVLHSPLQPVQSDAEIGALVINQGTDPSGVLVQIPANAAGQTFHVICEVHDDGPFTLASYRRIVIEVR